MSAYIFLTLFLIALAIYKLFPTKKSIVLSKSGKYTGDKVAILKPAPGPKPLPIIGSLHLLAKYKSPFLGFNDLAKQYGDIFSLKLGSSNGVVVNSLETIREVLNINGKSVGGRPNFERYNRLFAGDRNNSLALCDWSSLQTRRRNTSRAHCGPKPHSENYARIGTVANFETTELISTLQNLTRSSEKPVNIKPILQACAMNTFAHYMCSIRFDTEDPEFRQVVDHFDDIFYEINEGYAVDFIPWLAPFYKKHFDKLSTWSQDIRSFICKRILVHRENDVDVDAPSRDFLDELLKVLIDDPSVERNTIIFMLEDFLGGHSSVGNLVMLCLTAAARDPEVTKRIQAEIDGLKLKRSVTLSDKSCLPYTEAAVLEALRFASSPIVPHVATENLSVSGYGIEKDTVVLINNYALNMSEKLWDTPEKYDPSRFLEKMKTRVRRNSLCDSGLESDSERSQKNETVKETWAVNKKIPHFIPFSIGKRTCIGQTLVQTVTFIMFANIMREFSVAAVSPEDLVQKPANVSLPRETYSMYLLPRKC